MPTSTYVALATITATGSETSITFSSIPATYRDLIIVSTYSASHGFILAEFNSDDGSNYTFVEMYGLGSGSGASGTGTKTGAYLAYTNKTSQQQAYSQIMDYSATDKHKTVLSRHGAADGYTTAEASRWANTAAINSIKIKPDIGPFNSGSTFSLYGIAS